MDRPLSPDDVLAPRPTTGVLLLRGLRKRCPRCGGGGLYQRWFRMRARCPTCGHKFEREEGFFIGAWFVNLSVTEALAFALVMVFVLMKNANSDASVVPIVVVGVAFSVIGPIVFYPYSRTLWAAIDLAMEPLELDEIIEAEDALHPPEPTDDGPDGPAPAGEGPPATDGPGR